MLKWKKTGCYLGEYKVGSFFHDGCCCWDEVKQIKAIVMLPGIVAYVGHYETEKEASDAIVEVVKYWLQNAELQIKEST